MSRTSGDVAHMGSARDPRRSLKARNGTHAIPLFRTKLRPIPTLGFPQPAYQNTIATG